MLNVRKHIIAEMHTSVHRLREEEGGGDEQDDFHHLRLLRRSCAALTRASAPGPSRPGTSHRGFDREAPYSQCRPASRDKALSA